MAASTRTSMNKFKNLCFVGLNKVEYHPDGGDMLFADSWMDITDEAARRNLMLAFFAPRDLNGDPLDPAIVLSNDIATPDGDEAGGGNSILPYLKGAALFDFCQIRKAEPNIVHIIAVADVLFHWDANDNYIVPTSSDSWVNDLNMVLKSYPRTTQKHLYTAWDTAAIGEIEGLEVHPLKEMPMDTGMWLNQPTLQEKFGFYVLLAGISIAVLTYTGLEYQQQDIKDIKSQISRLSKASNLSPNFRKIMENVQDIEAFMRYRGMFSMVFKDVGLAIKDADFKVANYTLENPKGTSPSDSLVVEIEAKPGIYKGFDEQEQAAKHLMQASLTIEAVRKPPTSPGDTRFKLEGLIPLDKVSEKIKDYQKRTEEAASRSGGRKASSKSKQEAAAKREKGKE